MEKNIVKLDQNGTKGFSMVLFSIRLGEQHSTNPVKPNVAKYDFPSLKFSSFMDCAWQLEGASLHLEKVSCT